MSGAETLQAGCVSLDGRGLLIFGRPGSGKSRLALALLALGATLVADDLLHLRRAGDALIAEAPRGRSGLIEARGVGLLRAPAARAARIALAADLDRAESDRLPPRRSARLLGVAIPLILAADTASASALAAALRAGGPLDPEGPLEA